MILELCKGVYFVDLGESFQTHIYLQNLASIQPSPVYQPAGQPAENEPCKVSLRPSRPWPASTGSPLFAQLGCTADRASELKTSEFELSNLMNIQIGYRAQFVRYACWLRASVGGPPPPAGS